MSALTSTATFASPQTKSLRATIPEGIVAYLGIANGDRLEWRMEIENGDKVVKLKKAGLSKEGFESAATDFIRRKRAK